MQKTFNQNSNNSRVLPLAGEVAQAKDIGSHAIGASARIMAYPQITIHHQDDGVEFMAVFPVNSPINVLAYKEDSSKN